MKRKAMLMLFFLVSCRPAESGRMQGYVEGDFLYLAAPSGGKLATLGAGKGAEVDAGALLFELDPNPERRSRDAAAAALAASRAQLADARRGRRPSERAAVLAQQKQAEAALSFAEEEFQRQERLQKSPGVTSKQDFERARAARDEARERVNQLRAELETASLGSREDLVTALEAVVTEKEASLARAEWELAQKSKLAPEGGLLFDVLYRPGEWVPAGRPVLVLLPPERIKVRAFIPEPRLGALQLGQPVTVAVDGRDEPIKGTVSYISTRPEYTPPVIYSRENRAKLSFAVEISFPKEVARTLHPGQPVDVRLELQG